MSEPPEPEDSREEVDDVAVRELVRRALATDTVAKNPPDILRGVQRRLRLRSRGKLFADSWNACCTMHARHAYVVAALITLLLVALAYFALTPTDFR
jgi:hypothetical protein